MQDTHTIQRTAESQTNWLGRLVKTQVFKHLARIKHGALIVHDQGHKHTLGDPNQGPSIEVTVHAEDFYWDLALQGSVGAGAAYMKGHWDCSDLTGFIQLFVKNRDLVDQMEGGSAWVKNQLLKVGHRLNKNTRAGSRKNIADHYDLGNDLFATFLDPHMMYSSAMYANPNEPLAIASERKLRAVCEKLDLKPEDHLLEIGTGWGGLAVFAAATYGCRVTTTTISQEQYQAAKKRVSDAGLEDQVTVLDLDYRDLTGTYDKVVSIEMIEAVGHHFLPNYCEQIDHLLAPDGLALIQAITIEDSRYQQALKSIDFIKKYIFPGSFIPSVTAILNATTDHTTMKLVHLEDFGTSYAHTLRDWAQAFNASSDDLQAMGYDEAFQRLWNFYFSYCEGGFLERVISVVHLVLAKPQNRRQSMLSAL